MEHALKENGGNTMPATKYVTNIYLLLISNFKVLFVVPFLLSVYSVNASLMTPVFKSLKMKK